MGGQHAEPARQLGGGEPARELEEREWIAAGLGNDPVADSLVEAPGNPRRQQRARVVVAESFHHELREPVELLHVARLANREHHSDRLRLEAARDERQDLGGLLVEPLHVVDHAQERPLCRRTSERRLSAARPSRKRSGAGPSDKPNAKRSASRCGGGRCSTRSSIQAPTSCCSPARGNSISDSTPPARATRHPVARSTT